MSPEELKISLCGEFITFAFQGTFTVERGKMVVDAMIDECVARNCRRALLDCRAMSGEMAIVDRFDVVAYAQRTRDHIDRTALVGRPDQVLPDKFVESVAANRGFVLRVFSDPDHAAQWLRS